MNNIGLVEHVRKALAEGWGYVYGTYGQVLTEDILNYKLKQYPSNVKYYEDFIREQWLGKRTADCVNLIKSYLWWNNGNVKYDVATDTSADGMYARAVVKGGIYNIPEVPGILVWHKGHIGVYVGNGDVIESRGTRYGVVKTRLLQRPWTNWCQCPFIDYIEKTPADGITVIVNGQKLEMDVEPVNVNGRVLVPVRAVAEAFGATVMWDGDSQTVNITKAPG